MSNHISNKNWTATKLLYISTKHLPTRKRQKKKNTRQKPHIVEGTMYTYFKDNSHNFKEILYFN